MNTFKITCAVAVFEPKEKYMAMKGIHSCHSTYSEDQNFFRKAEEKAVQGQWKSPVLADL